MVALVSFVEHLPIDSELGKEMNPKEEMPLWCTTLKTNIILADIFDAFAASKTKKGRKPPVYPRPKHGQNTGIGKDAIPISEFWDWWNKEK